MKWLVTGGTGTLGKAVIKRLLTYNYEVVCFSRDELKQFELETELNNPNVEFVIGDVRDYRSIKKACHGVKYIIHTAALKHVATGERTPWEVIQTNVIGTKNVVDVANSVRAEMVLVSTDKAVEPVNLYGATKMTAEHLTLTGGQHVVRFGNIFGSRGSVLHKFKEWTAKGHTFKITDKRMTRFIVLADEAVDYILKATDHEGVYVPTLPAIRIIDLAAAFDPEAEIEEIGMFPGEKLHESLQPGVASCDARFLTVEEIRGLIDEAIR